jgi:hypothetical protein
VRTLKALLLDDVRKKERKELIENLVKFLIENFKTKEANTNYEACILLLEDLFSEVEKEVHQIIKEKEEKK